MFSLFWKSTVTVALVGLSLRSSQADALATTDPNPKIASAVRLKSQSFPLSDVRLLDGPFLDAMKLDCAYLLSLDPNRLLHTFRITAGLPTSARPYGGWESPGGELRGHSMGHYLSACAFMYASTGNEELKARVDSLVTELAKCQEALPAKGYNKGFLSAYPEEFFDRVDACKRVWAPYYTLHKIMAGLVDAHVLCHNPQALEVLNQMCAWLKFRIGRLSHEQQQKALGNEHGGMNEVLANIYAITGNPDHLQLAKDFNHDEIFAPLARGEDKLDGKHANTQIPKITGAVREYELTGDKALLTVAATFWRAVALNRSYVIGGHSDAEHFFPVTDFSKHLSPVTCESCNTYNMLKLTRHLFALEPSAEFMDFYERALYNQILGSIEPKKGMVNYFVSLKPGHFKVYSTPEDSFWCCTGSGMENHAKYPETIFYFDERSLYLNLFIPAELRWKARGLTVRQETKFPENDSTKLTFHCEKPQAFALKLRWPAWALNGLHAAVNGAEVKLEGKPGSYVGIEREWKDGDVVEIRLPMALHTEDLPGNNPRIKAVLYGPIVLAGELGTEGLEKTNFWLKNQLDLNRAPTPRIPQLVCEPEELLSKIEPVVGNPLTFRTHGIGRPADITLSPLYKLHFQRYSVYWNLLTKADWAKHEAQIAAEAAERKAFEVRIVDEIQPGEQQPETDHNLKGDRTRTGEFSGRKWRDASNGWFSYDLKTAANEKLTLRCTYWGSDSKREFDILIDGQKIATQKLNKSKPNQFLEVDYAIPAELTKSKDPVTVKFQSCSGDVAGGIFGILLLKPELRK